MSYSSLFNSGLGRRGVPEDRVPDAQSSVESFMDTATPQTSGRNSPQPGYSQHAQNYYSSSQPPRASAAPAVKSKTQRDSPRRSSWSPAVHKLPPPSSYDTRSIMEFPSSKPSDVASIRSVRSTNRHSNASTIKQSQKANLKLVTQPIPSHAPHSYAPHNYAPQSMPSQHPNIRAPPPPTGPPPSIPQRRRRDHSFLALSDSPLDVIQDEHAYSPQRYPTSQYSHPTPPPSSFNPHAAGYSPQNQDRRYSSEELPSPTQSTASGRSSGSSKSKILQKLFSFPRSSKQKD